MPRPYAFGCAFAAFVAAMILAAPASAQDTARYRVELEIAWSSATHPHEYPAGAHLSDLIGATHTGAYVMFADGDTPSSGLELLAENGRATIIEAEIAEARRRGRVGATFKAEGTYVLPGRMAAELEATARHSRVSFVTMIAPSPDWFTGLAGVELFVGDRWVDRIELPLWAWDAGTDGGATYAAPDLDTQPRQSVRLLATPHMLDAAGLKRFGTARFERLP